MEHKLEILKKEHKEEVMDLDNSNLEIEMKLRIIKMTNKLIEMMYNKNPLK